MLCFGFAQVVVLSSTFAQVCFCFYLVCFVLRRLFGLLKTIVCIVLLYFVLCFVSVFLCFVCLCFCVCVFRFICVFPVIFLLVLQNTTTSSKLVRQSDALTNRWWALLSRSTSPKLPSRIRAQTKITKLIAAMWLWHLSRKILSSTKERKSGTKS